MTVWLIVSQILSFFMMQVIVMCNSIGDQNKGMQAGLSQSHSCFCMSEPLSEARIRSHVLGEEGLSWFCARKGPSLCEFVYSPFFRQLKGLVFFLADEQKTALCVCNLFTWIGSKTSKCSSQCGIGTQQSMSHWASCVANNWKPAVCLWEKKKLKLKMTACFFSVCVSFLTLIKK